MSLAWLKLDVILGSIGKLAAASLLVTTLGLTGCGDDPVKAGVAKGCTLNSDCNGGLVCSFGLCHQECEQTTDCPANQRCVKTDTSNVCQLADESQCHFNTDCSDPLVCAIDLQCRNQCNGKADCLEGQECADHVCAEPAEVADNGGLKGAVGAGGDGAGGNSSTGGSAGKAGSGGSTMGDAGDNAGGMPPVGPCVAGDPCVPEGMPCQVGTTACAGDVATCEMPIVADDGTACGTDQVCSAGACVDCKAGDTCSPEDGNVCVTGTLSCATGPSCDSSVNVKAGTSCGTDKVCSVGACVACVVDEACDPAGNACKNGKMACGSGPVCTPTTNKKAGDACDTGKVCDAGGACTACVQNDACSPTGNSCHKGTQDCSNGPNCIDTLLAADDGSACMGNATYNFCTAGTCLACQNGNACIPANPCHKGTLNCGTTPPICNDSNANAVDGLACGDSKSCISGACLTNDRVLKVTSGAVPDVAINAPFATVTVSLVDGNSAAVSGSAVTVTATPGAYAQATATNGQGKTQISGRVGRAVGKNTFTVSAPGATAITFDVNGVAPADSNIFTIANAAHLNGVPTVGAATLSKIYSEARAVTVASDGTLYFADYCAVYSVSVQGALDRVAGSPTEGCGNSGDSGPAATALLSTVYGLALDEPNKLLYIADAGNTRVRVVDLSPAVPKIYPFAGGGPNTQPWGDPGPADAAYVNPTGIAVAPNSDVFISDANTGRVRRVDSLGQISMYLDPTGTCATTPLIFKGCGYYGDNCSFAWDASGQMFVAGKFCGNGAITTQFAGIARVNAADKSLTLVAGTTGQATPSEGGTAASVAFASTPAIAFDKVGNLYLTSRDDQRVRRIDAVTTQVTTIGGTGTVGVGGEYVLGASTPVHSPTTLGFDSKGNLYFADSANWMIRGLWNVGSKTASTGKLATTGGTGQTVTRDAPFAALTVKVTDAANAAVSGVGVNWKRLETGSGLSSTGVSSIVQKTTAVTGLSSMSGHVGLASGAYHFEANYSDIHGTPVTGSPQSFTVTAADPAAGIIFPVMNFAHVGGTTGVPGPATFAKMYSNTFGVATAADGTMYASDYSTVYKITTRGEASVLAGNPAGQGFSGDSGPAASAQLNQPRGLALDEAKGVLYIADYGNKRIRMVTLADGKIYTFAGGGTVAAKPWGDGGDPTAADIGNPYAVAVDPDGSVYIPDVAHYGIRIVDSGGVQIDTWFAPSYGNAGCVAGVPSFYYAEATTTIHFLANGDAYIGGYICQGTNTGAAYGILLRKKSATTFTRIVGLTGAGSSSGENIDALVTTLPYMADFAVEANGNLVLSLDNNHLLRRIDMTTGKINTIAGDGTAGYSLPGDVSTDPGAFVAASGVRVSTPYRITTWQGHLLFADQGNQAIRMIW